MRTYRIAGLLVALLVAISVGLAPATAQQDSGVDSANVPAPLAHPIVGPWLATVGSQTGTIAFAADGTVTLRLAPLQYGDPGMVQTSPALGTWEAMGETGATFTVVQQFWHEHGGVLLGTATITGYVALDQAGETLTDDGALTTIIQRDAAGNIISVRAVEGTAPYLTATRRPAGEISPDSEPTGRSACSTCTRLPAAEIRGEPSNDEPLRVPPPMTPRGFSRCAVCR